MNDKILSYLVQSSKSSKESLAVSYINRSTRETIIELFAGSGYCIKEFDFTKEAPNKSSDLLQLSKTPSLYLLKFADNERSRLAISQFIYRLCTQLTDFADRQKDGKLPVETSLFLGEFEYLERLPKWGIYTGIMRKINLHTVMLINSFFRFRKVYSSRDEKNDWVSLLSYNMAFCYAGTLIIRDHYKPDSPLAELYSPFFRINQSAVPLSADEKTLSYRVFKLISGGLHAAGRENHSFLESLYVRDDHYEYHKMKFKRVPYYAPNRLALQLLCSGKISESEFFSTLINSAYTLVSFVPHQKIKDWKLAMLEFLDSLCNCVRVNSSELISFIEDFIACAQEENARTQMYYDFSDFQGFNNMELKDVISSLQFYCTYMNDLKQQVIDEGSEEFNVDFNTLITAYRSCFISNDSRLECDFDFCLIAWIAGHNPRWSDRDILNAVNFTCAVDDLLEECMQN